MQRGGGAATSARSGGGQDQTNRRLDVPVEMARRNAVDAKAALPEPPVPGGIASRISAHPVPHPIHFDSQFGRRTIEVEHIGAYRMLAAKLQAVGPRPQDLPQPGFWPAHYAPERPCLADGGLRRAPHSPSTALRAVPLPIRCADGEDRGTTSLRAFNRLKFSFPRIFSSSPSRSDGEGDHAKHGGGAIPSRQSPSTALRAVPLPMLRTGRTREGLNRPQGLVEVGDQIVGILHADRDPHQIVGDPQRLLALVGHGKMGHRRRGARQSLGAP